jgi:hypothetical protein
MKLIHSASLLAFSLLVLLIAGPANAQATRTWVSGVGDDVNPCSRTAPCKTWAGAISKTAAGGEIDTLDPGGFGTLTITKAITIADDGTGAGSALASGTNGFTIAAGVNDVVTLRGLQINGVGQSSSSGLVGVQFNSGAQLIVDHCKIFGFLAANGVGSGINFQPTGASKLDVVDTVISNNGSTGGTLGSSGNVLIQPQSGGSAMAHFNNVKLLDGFGYNIRADGTIAGAGATNVTLYDVVADGSPNAGVVAAYLTGGGAVNMLLDSVVASNNTNFGVKSNGALVTVRMTRSTVTNNGTGLSAINSGVLASNSNNTVAGNGTDGAPTTTFTSK